MCDDHITHHHCLENTVKRLWVFVSFIIDNEPPILLLWETWKLHRVMVVQLFSWVPNIWHSFNNALYYPSFIPSVSVRVGVSGRGKIRPITASAASQRSWTAFWRRLEMCSGKKKICNQKTQTISKTQSKPNLPEGHNVFWGFIPLFFTYTVLSPARAKLGFELSTAKHHKGKKVQALCPECTSSPREN